MHTMENMLPLMSRAVLMVLLVAPALCSAGPLAHCGNQTEGRFDDTNLAGTWRIVYGPTGLRDDVNGSKLLSFYRVTPENVDGIKKTFTDPSIAWEKVEYMFQAQNASVHFPVETIGNGRYSTSGDEMQLHNLGDYVAMQICSTNKQTLLLHKGHPSRSDVQNVVAAYSIEGVFAE